MTNSQLITCWLKEMDNMALQYLPDVGAGLCRDVARCVTDVFWMPHFFLKILETIVLRPPLENICLYLCVCVCSVCLMVV